MVGGRGVRQALSSTVTESELFCAVDVDAGSSEGLVRIASTVEREWVDGGRTRASVEAVFDEKSRRVVGRRRVYLGPLLLEESDQPLSDANTVEALRAEGKYRVLTPDACIDVARAESPGGIFLHFPLCGGTPPDLGWKSLELYAEKVMPHLTEASAEEPT